MDGNGDPTLTLETFKTEIQTLTSAKRLWVAYSGGLDSHVLLDLSVRAFAEQLDYPVSALHIHHGIHPNADHWAQHCERICENFAIPLTVLWVDGNVVDGRSPEEVAREARFAAFENFLGKDDCLLLAHHEEDQAETILLRLFRGSGPLGLSGIPKKSRVGESELIRPLLAVSQETIKQYAKVRHLKWIEDDSNHNTRFDRNYLRHEIMPLLQRRWPRVVRSINRAGTLCFETASAVQVLAMQDLETVRGEDAHCLSVSRLLLLEPVRRRGVLRFWLQDLGFTLPSRDHIERIDREMLKAKPGSRPRLKISSYEIRRTRDLLSVVSLSIGGIHLNSPS